MPSTPFDAAHQDNLRAMIGKVLPSAGAQPIAAAVAAGYDFMEAAGLDPEANPMDLLDELRRMQPCCPAKSRYLCYASCWRGADV